jgi:hypothetical protein
MSDDNMGYGGRAIHVPASSTKAGVTPEPVETTADVTPEDPPATEKPADEGKRDKTRGDKTKDIV